MIRPFHLAIPVSDLKESKQFYQDILGWEQWHKFSNRIKDQIEFIIEPYIRFKNQSGEQVTMFFLDPDKNALEFKAFKNDNIIFKK